MSRSKCETCGYLNDNCDNSGKTSCMFHQVIGTPMCDYYNHFLVNNWESNNKNVKEAVSIEEDDNE